MVNRTACSLFSTCGWMLFTASTEHYPVYYPGALANKNTDLQLFFRGRLTVLFYCAISIWLVGSQLLFLSPFVFFQKWFFFWWPFRTLCSGYRGVLITVIWHHTRSRRVWRKLEKLSVKRVMSTTWGKESCWRGKYVSLLGVWSRLFEPGRNKNACWSHIGLIWHERFLDFLAHAPPLAKTMKAGS